jgi:hypothetical protein
MNARLERLEKANYERKTGLEEQLANLQAQRWALLASGRVAESHKLLPQIEATERELGLELTTQPQNVVEEQHADDPALMKDVRRVARISGIELRRDED